MFLWYLSTYYTHTNDPHTEGGSGANISSNVVDNEGLFVPALIFDGLHVPKQLLLIEMLFPVGWLLDVREP